MTDVLFNRDFTIQVGTLKILAREPGEENLTIPTLRVVFSIKKSTASEPNEATIEIYNLSKNNRKLLQEKDAVIIEAGYTKTLQQIFSGDVTLISHIKESVDWVTRIECGDGTKEYRAARINISFGAGTKIKDVLETAVKSMKLELGNTLDKIGLESFRKNKTEFSTGVVLSGLSSDVVSNLMSSAGFQWSIQDKALQVLKPAETTEEEIVFLNAASGLVGTPEIGEKGIVLVKSLLQGEIKPGRKIKIKSKTIDGFFKIESVIHSGDTWGAEWYSDVEGKPLQ